MQNLARVAAALAAFLSSVVSNDPVISRCSRESSWGPWWCPGEEKSCTDVSAVRYKCPGGECTEQSPCAWIPEFREFKPCSMALNAGQCWPMWGTWSQWSACSATCGITERSRFRACEGVWHTSTAEPPKGSCADSRFLDEGVQRRSCPMRRLCPRVAGGWSEWGHFSACSVTCGKGSRQRIRLCNRPAAQGGGVPCQGIDTQKIVCDVGVACPQDGNWCPWTTSVEKCSAPCGDSGMGLRTRRCNCPLPANGGKGCSPPLGAKETARIILSQIMLAATKGHTESTDALPSMAAIAAIADGSGKWEACNRKYCPYLKHLTDSEQEIIVSDLGLQKSDDVWAWSGFVPAHQFDPVGLHCPSTRKSRVEIFDKKDRFPRARSYWTVSIGRSALQRFNFPGVPLTDSRRLRISGDRMVLRNLDIDDEGIYRFGYEYEENRFATICFFAVYVKRKIKTVSSGGSCTIKCNAEGLWPIVQQTPNETWSIFWSYDPDDQAQGLGAKKYRKMWEVKLHPPLTQVRSRSKRTAQMVSENALKNHSILFQASSSSSENLHLAMTLFDTGTQRLDDLEESRGGDYICIVTNNRPNARERRFIMSHIYVKVVPPPTLFQLFKTWLTANLKSVLALICTAGFVIVSYMALVKIRAKKRACVEEDETPDNLDETEIHVAQF